MWIPSEKSQGNTEVEEASLDPYWYENPMRRLDENWEEKLGQALGNLQSLEVLRITYNDDDFDAYEMDPPDRENFSRVVQQIWQRITLHVSMEPTLGSELAFARAIQGHPAIQRFETRDSFDYSPFGILLSALTTLPALEYAVLGHVEHYPGDRLTLQHPKQLTRLLRSPSLRPVELRIFILTSRVCESVALTLRTDTSPPLALS